MQYHNPINFSERVVYFLIKSILEEKLGAERVETKQHNLCNWSSRRHSFKATKYTTLTVPVEHNRTVKAKAGPVQIKLAGTNISNF